MEPWDRRPGIHRDAITERKAQQKRAPAAVVAKLIDDSLSRSLDSDVVFDDESYEGLERLFWLGVIRLNEDLESRKHVDANAASKTAQDFTEHLIEEVKAKDSTVDGKEAVDLLINTEYRRILQRWLIKGAAKGAARTVRLGSVLNSSVGVGSYDPVVSWVEANTKTRKKKQPQRKLRISSLALISNEDEAYIGGLLRASGVSHHNDLRSQLFSLVLKEKLRRSGLPLLDINVDRDALLEQVNSNPGGWRKFVNTNAEKVIQSTPDLEAEVYDLIFQRRRDDQGAGQRLKIWKLTSQILRSVQDRFCPTYPLC
jgi:hypothetical protein